MQISKNLDENITYLERVYQDSGDIVKRKFPIGTNKNLWAYLIYIDNMSSREVVEKCVLQGLMIDIRMAPPGGYIPPDMSTVPLNVYDALKDGGITTADLSETSDFDTVHMAILSGDTPLFIDGFDKVIIISTKGFPGRGVSAAETEMVVQGSKEAFSEGLRTNTALIRRRIRDTNLKVKQMVAGRRSKTDIALVYLDDVVRKDILEEAEKRIENIDIDAILDSGYIEQFIEDDWMSPFPQTQVTERPDKAASAILEGRIAIVVDNSPFVILIPVTMNAFYQSSEDYYQRWGIMSFIRVLRYIAGIIAVTLPALYIAIAVYHPSMIPMFLVFRMAGARSSVPFPAVGEILLMELAFELLREAGIRLPSPLGGTIGIVGGIIIGQAAVEAGLVSPIVVIVVALTGIASFAIPNISLVAGYRITKYLLIGLSAFLGLFGLWMGLLFVLIHLVSLKSFGIPYLFPFAAGGVNGYTDMKDTVLRLPLFTMKKRPIFASPSEKNRLKDEEIGNSHKKE